MSIWPAGSDGQPLFVTTAVICDSVQTFGHCIYQIQIEEIS